MVTRDAIQALKGRELDAKVAEVVFGWRWITLDFGGTLSSILVLPEIQELFVSPGGGWQNGKLGTPTVSSAFPQVPAYSSTWEGMGLLVEEMVKREYLPTFTINGESLWYAEFFISSEDYGEGCGETAPLAVARAALLALREEER